MRDLDTQSITAEVLRRMEGMPGARLRNILASLTEHLHAFARDVDLTEEEWLQGIAFLTRTGHACDDRRQEFILLSDVLGLSQLVVSKAHRRIKGATEQTVFGPFHVKDAPERPHGYDISEAAPGQRLIVETRVETASGDPVTGALVEVWHADTHGTYDTQNPDWTPQRVRFRGNFRTGLDGRIRFRTIMPVSYPIPMDGPVGDYMRATRRSPYRPAHLHFRVEHAGFSTLVTHAFDELDPHLDDDAVFGVLNSTICRFEPNGGGMRLCNRLVLAPRPDTPADQG
ncbi:dioxygenase [Sphingobium sp. B2]|uniref:dioxygenase family protein n=1 Tax=Sphingobium sp. B2 TaxID=2583228 RepID=UPI0011A196F0|nr:dioxygenase [Sphingobium sp. B2]